MGNCTAGSTAFQLGSLAIFGNFGNSPLYKVLLRIKLPASAPKIGILIDALILRFCLTFHYNRAKIPAKPKSWYEGRKKPGKTTKIGRYFFVLPLRQD